MDTNIKTRMNELIATINHANHVYYNEDNEVMSNYEYDKLYQELENLETQTGIILSNSPTQQVGSVVVSKLPKEKHTTPMLSLNKTKSIEELRSFIGDNDVVLSWKLDGLTLVLTYEDGCLTKAVTRGNGTTGEVVTENAKHFKNVPLTIPHKGLITVRGEAVISYSDFEEINSLIPDETQKHKNPRNLCSGSVRYLDSARTKDRRVQFIAFALVSSDVSSFEHRTAQLTWLEELGFSTVPRVVTTSDGIDNAVRNFENNIETYNIPSDGLVLQYDNIKYGTSLGSTSKCPRDSIAFKWEDEIKETILTDVQWNVARTGMITPVAIFEPVELEGTTVTRASVHNVSILEKLNLCVGDTITIFKANMIIPQIADNLSQDEGQCHIPTICPVCGEPTTIRQQNEAKSLYCNNPDCSAKHIAKFTHFVKRDAMNIDGLSEATLERLMDIGLLNTFVDIFKLKDVDSNLITQMEGFGDKSYQKLITSIENSKTTTFNHVLYALGIDNVGRTASRLICNHFNYDVVRIVNATHAQLTTIDTIGDTIASSFTEYFQNQHNQFLFEELLHCLNLTIPELTTPTESSITGMVFVVTGSVKHFANRNELKSKIESMGGKVTGSVTGKTNYLINNDNLSTTSKNKKAVDLGIPIITEEEFITMCGG